MKTIIFLLFACQVTAQATIPDYRVNYESGLYCRWCEAPDTLQPKPKAIKQKPVVVAPKKKRVITKPIPQQGANR